MSAAVIILIVFVAASSGGFFKPGEWYEGLKKPSWTPPKWAFPVVWTILYAMIAYAGILIWDLGGWSLAMGLWGLQIVVNAAWSWIFFGRRQMGLALLDLSILWLAIAAFILVAWPMSPLAAALFIPYLVWVTAAGMLNLSVLRLNPA